MSSFNQFSTGSFFYVRCLWSLCIFIPVTPSMVYATLHQYMKPVNIETTCLQRPLSFAPRRGRFGPVIQCVAQTMDADCSKAGKDKSVLFERRWPKRQMLPLQMGRRCEKWLIVGGRGGGGIDPATFHSESAAPTARTSVEGLRVKTF